MKKTYLLGFTMCSSKTPEEKKEATINIICVSEKELGQAPLFETLSCLSKNTTMQNIKDCIETGTFKNIFFIPITEWKVSGNFHIGNIGENIELHLHSVITEGITIVLNGD
jgi:hypothetical protein